MIAADLERSSVIFCIKAVPTLAQQMQPLYSETMVGAGGCPEKCMLSHTHSHVHNIAQDWGGVGGVVCTDLGRGGPGQCRACVVICVKGHTSTKAIPQQAVRHCTKELPGMSRRV